MDDLDRLLEERAALRALRAEIKEEEAKIKGLRALRGLSADCVVSTGVVDNDDLVDFVDHSGLWMEVQ